LVELPRPSALRKRLMHFPFEIIIWDTKVLEYLSKSDIGLVVHWRSLYLFNKRVHNNSCSSSGIQEMKGD
jgi:hypothetical protein